MTATSTVARALFAATSLVILPASASRRIGLLAGGWIRAPANNRLSVQAEGLSDYRTTSSR